jgi:sugar phosphate isomerase/epimerase
MLCREWFADVELVAASWMAEGQRPSAEAPPCPIPLERRLDAAAKAGFVGIGLNRADYESLLARHGVTSLAGMLSDAGMRHVEMETLTGWWLDDPDGSLWRAALDRMLELAAVFPVRQIKVNGDFGPAPPAIEAMRDGFARLAERAHAAGTAVGLEPVIFSNVRDAATARGIVGDATAGGGATLDCWHFARGGLPPQELGGLEASAICGVEMSNIGPAVVGDLFKDTLDHRRLPDDGSYDVAAFLAAVAKAGFRGPIGCEVLSIALREQPLEQALRRAADSARTVLAEAAKATGD